MKRSNKSGRYRHMDFFILDILCLEATYILAYVYRFGPNWARYTAYYMQINFLIIIAAALFITFRRSYRNILHRGFIRECFEVVLFSSFVWLFILVFFYIMNQALIFYRAILPIVWGGGAIAMIVIRTLWKKTKQVLLAQGDYLPRLLLLSSASTAKKWTKEMEQRRYKGFQFLGIALSDDFFNINLQKINSYRVLCRQEGLQEYVRTHVVDEVLILASFDPELLELCNALVQMGVKVHLGLEKMLEGLPLQEVDFLGDQEVITSSIQTIGMGELIIKRIIDVLAGLGGTFITGILFLFLSPFIYFKSPGPIFFRQIRIGKNGRKFYIYKFRSMYMDAEERKKELMEQNQMKGLMFKMKNDPRIIGSERGEGKGIGNFIRKTSLDEFPQFVNVLKGDMSLIGTRPPTLEEYRQYDFHHKARLGMLPGITGLWQVSGRSDILDFEEIVKLDKQYIENWSLWLDWKILFKTFQVVLKGKGAE